MRSKLRRSHILLQIGRLPVFAIHVVKAFPYSLFPNLGHLWGTERRKTVSKAVGERFGRVGAGKGEGLS